MGRDEAVDLAMAEADGHVFGDAAKVFHRALRECGYAVVPLEPTPEQRAVGRHEVGTVFDAGSFEIMAVASYRAMLEAAR